MTTTARFAKGLGPNQRSDGPPALLRPVGVFVLFLAILLLAMVIARNTGGNSSANQAHGVTEPIQISEPDSTIILTAGNTDFVLPSIAPEIPIPATVDHLATVSGPLSNVDMFMYDKTADEFAESDNGILHCIGAYQTNGEGGSICAVGFANPETVISQNAQNSAFNLGLFFARDQSKSMRVETDTGYVVESNIINGSGFVQWDRAHGTPRWLSLFDASGNPIWSDRLS